MTSPKVKENLENMKVKEELKVQELLAELNKHGIHLAKTTVYTWVERGYIPENLVRIEKRMRRKFYYFKPEVIDYLLEKLGKG